MSESKDKIEGMMTPELEKYGLSLRSSSILQRDGFYMVKDILTALANNTLRNAVSDFAQNSQKELERAIKNARRGVIQTTLNGNEKGAPTPEQIRERCKEIQNQWSESEEKKRSVCSNQPWSLQEVKMPFNPSPIEE